MLAMHGHFRDRLELHLAFNRSNRLAGRVKILLVSETLLPGGAETFVLRLANALVGEHDVALAILHGEMVKAELRAKLDPRIKVHLLKVPAKRALFKVDSLLRRLHIDKSVVRRAQQRWLAKLVDPSPPDVIHSHLFKADHAASLIRAAHPRIRHLITLHGDYAPFHEGRADPQLLKLAPRMAAVIDRADGIVAVCREQVQWIGRVFPDATTKTRLHYNGYAPWRARLPTSLAQEGGRLRFGMVSRGVEKKGWAKAIAAFARLPRDSAELILVGEGHYLDMLSRGQLPDGVRFVGFSADPVDWIEQFDVGLLPSEFPNESLPTVVMEYLFCNAAVIATDVGEIAAMMRTPDSVLAGQLLPFDGAQISVDALAAAMQRYLDDPAQLAADRSKAGAAFAKFDMAQCGRAYVTVYRSLVEG